MSKPSKSNQSFRPYDDISIFQSLPQTLSQYQWFSFSGFVKSKICISSSCGLKPIDQVIGRKTEMLCNTPFEKFVGNKGYT